MVEYNPKNWFRHITLFHKSDTLRILLPEMAIMALYTAVMAWVELHLLTDFDLLRNTMTVHSLLGFVISLLLVFRTNSAYDRWWEGRKHWGALVNVSRNLALRVDALVPEEHTATRDFFSKMIPNYAFAMKEHLRSGVVLEQIEDSEGVVEALTAKDHGPNVVAGAIYKRAKGLNRDGIISNEEFLMMDKEIKALTDIVGACERIKKTPIPFSYNLFIKKFMFIYVITLPLGLVPAFQWWTVPIVVFIFYVLVSMELLAEEIEDPFGLDANDLPTDALAATIRRNVQEIL